MARRTRVWCWSSGTRQFQVVAFGGVLNSDHFDFDFHCSMFYRSPKITKIIVYILYIRKNVSKILILICWFDCVVISFQGYRISLQSRSKFNIKLQYLHIWSTYKYYNPQIRSGSNRFEPVLKITGHSEPLTGPSVRFFPGREPWTEPRSGSARFRFEPRFWTERYHP